MILAGVEVGKGQPCRFVFEMSNAHNGDLGQALKLIHTAKAVGCDLVKFQAYTADELVRLRGDGPAPSPWGDDGWTMRRLYEKARTPLEWFPALAAECAAVGIPWFASVFGPTSLAAMEAIKCPAYKIARLDNTSLALAQAIAETGKITLMSRAKDERPKAYTDTYFLYCPPGYPADADWLPEFREFGHIGLSFHSATARITVLAAVARGCKIVEMHGHLGAEPSELEAEFSLDEDQWRSLIAGVRIVERVCGL